MIKQDSTIGANRLAPNKLIESGKRFKQSVPQMAFNGEVAPKIKRAGISKRISTNPQIKHTFSYMGVEANFGITPEVLPPDQFHPLDDPIIEDAYKSAKQSMRSPDPNQPLRDGLRKSRQHFDANPYPQGKYEPPKFNYGKVGISAGAGLLIGGGVVAGGALLANRFLQPKEENYMYYDKGMVYFEAQPVKKGKKLTDYPPEEFAKLPAGTRQKLLEEAQGEAAGVDSSAPILTPEQRRIQTQDRLDREQNLSKIREGRGWINTIGNTGREFRSWGNTLGVWGN